MMLLLQKRGGLVRSGLISYFDFFKLNLLESSEDFAAAAWTPAAVTVTADDDTSPAGTTSADLLQPSSSDSSLRQAVEVRQSQDYTFSVYLKAPSGTVDLNLEILDAAQSALQTVPVTATASWQRFEATANSAANTTLHVGIGGGSSWAAGEDVHAWGAQINEGPGAAAYEETTDNQLVRDLGTAQNHLTLGSTAGVDANDPVWRQHTLSCEGSQFARLETTAGLPAGNSDLTMMLVAKMTGVTATHVLFGYGSDAGGGTPHLQITSADLLRAGFLGAGNVVGTADAINSQAGYFAGTFRYRASDLLLEIILNEFADQGSINLAAAPSITNERLVVGARFFGANSAPVDAAHALIYNRRLADSEVRENYRWLKRFLGPRGISLN